MKGKIIIFIFSLTVLLSCTEKNKNPCSISDSTLVDLNKLDSIIKVPEIRKRDKDWNMDNYDEPSLFEAENEIYRFILSNSFGSTIIIRTEFYNGRYHAFRKEFDGYTGAPETKMDAWEFEISEEIWNNIVNGLVDRNFWTYPYSDERLGLDGAMWTLEGYKPKKDPCTLKNYHVISRWSPIDTTFIQMCDLLYELKPDTIKGDGKESRYPWRK